MTSSCSIILLFVKQVFEVYAITLILASSSILEPFRYVIIKRYPGLYSPLNSWIKAPLVYEKHFIECRMCMGFWVSLFSCIYYNNLSYFVVVFGISYFICTQER
jgi:hypothetical protein